MLVYRNRKLAVDEAKAWDKALTEGVGQAKDYAVKMAVRFAYATNGQGIYGIDMQTGKEGELPCYPTPDELWALTFAAANAWRDRFAAVPFEDKGGSHPSRYYQDIAVERAMEAIAENWQRILLTLATGTGKTFIAFQIAWKLFHSRWNLSREPSRRPRILFLADRNILANQAYNAFSAFPEDAMVRIEPGDIRKRGKLPEFFKDEAELRALWSVPETRKKLLQGLAEKGFGGEQLAEMQTIIDAEKSDLFDVLAHVAYALPPLTREERATKAKVVISTHFNSKQQVFLDFVLSHYISVGVEELDQDKLTPLLRLKYHNSIADAVTDLGRPDEIGRVFAGFQKYLYQQQVAA